MSAFTVIKFENQSYCFKDLSGEEMLKVLEDTLDMKLKWKSLTEVERAGENKLHQLKKLLSNNSHPGREVDSKIKDIIESEDFDPYSEGIKFFAKEILTNSKNVFILCLLLENPKVFERIHECIPYLEPDVINRLIRGAPQEPSLYPHFVKHIVLQFFNEDGFSDVEVAENLRLLVKVYEKEETEVMKDAFTIYMDGFHRISKEFYKK